MKINYRRGLVRLWIVVSTIYVLAVAAFLYGNVKAEFQQAGLDWSKAGILMLPVVCSDARGKESEDYENGPWNNYRTQALCWYQEPKFRAFFPEYKDLSSDELSSKLYAKAGIQLQPPRPWHALGFALLVAIGPPLAVLAVGIALSWAFIGFAST